jgi:hypothetical protein
MKSVGNERRRGRPSKFGRPSQLVALTLPVDVVRGLRRIDGDIARAIVRLFEGAAASSDAELSEDQQQYAELLKIADRRALIVVNPAVISSLPGISMIPLDGRRAFLALEPGHGVSDLELAVIDCLDESEPGRERQALQSLRGQLRTWRRDPALRFHGRSIIVVETVTRSRMRHASKPAGTNTRSRDHRAHAAMAHPDSVPVGRVRNGRGDRGRPETRRL